MERIYKEFKKELDLAYKIRCFEEALLDLYSKGLLTGTVHTCIGQELTGVLMKKYSISSDFWFSNHRGHGHYLAKTSDFHGLMAEILGKEDGCSKGFGGSQHLFNHNFISNGIQGGLVPIAAGVSLSKKYNKQKGVSVCFIGDGTLGEGQIYEAMNIASNWGLPLLLVIENNSIAQSTPQDVTFSGNLRKRVEGFGMKFLTSNTSELEELDITIREAFESCRNNIPTCIEIKTNRLKAHSKGDDNRDSNLIESLKEKDLLNQLISSEIIDSQRGSMEIETLVNKIINESSDSKYSEDFSFINYKPVEYNPLGESEGRVNENINTGLIKLFETKPATFMIGEDIEWKPKGTEKAYGGAFKVSQNLSELFGVRVMNTPISEAAIVGIGIGLALEGNLAIVEIMFGDFITLTIDQLIQQASKITSMFGRKLDLPLIIRTPMGGHRGYGPTHSQSLEKILLGVPNIDLISINYRQDITNIYANKLSEINKTTIVFEDKVGYTKFQNTERIPGYLFLKTNERFPGIRIKPKFKVPTVAAIICYGQTIELVEKALLLLFNEQESFAEVFCISQLQPLNCQPIIDLLVENQNLLILEEGSSIGSLGGVISSEIIRNKISLEKFEILSNNNTISANKKMEDNQLLSPEKIYNCLKSMI